MADRQTAALRPQVWAMTDGYCFYCGTPFVDDRMAVPTRDWLLMQPNTTMSTDHKLPKQRGGSDRLENLTPCCHRCNSQKNLATVEEYRLREGLNNGELPHHFHGDEHKIERDFIVVVSPAFIRPMVLHNFPDAIAASRGRGR